MTVVTCSHTVHCWCLPPPLWPIDRARWDSFCMGINARIQRVRHLEGRDDIETFSPPIPPRAGIRARPVGRLFSPANLGDRDADGRFSRRAS